MPRSVALSVLRTRCKQRSDMENDSHIADSEWNTLISEMVGELHELADEAGLRYFETSATITATGASSYAVPSDHLATISITLLDSASRPRRELDEWQIHQGEHPLSGQTGEAQCYAIVGQTIEFYPNPASGSYRHRYVPQPASLASAADGDAVDLICPAGEAFVVWGVKVKAADKSETAVQVAMAERDRARERVSTWLQGRNFVTPRNQMPRSTDDDEYERWRGA